MGSMVGVSRRFKLEGREILFSGSGRLEFSEVGI